MDFVLRFGKATSNNLEYTGFANIRRRVQVIKVIKKPGSRTDLNGIPFLHSDSDTLIIISWEFRSTWHQINRLEFPGLLVVVSLSFETKLKALLVKWVVFDYNCNFALVHQSSHWAQKEDNVWHSFVLVITLVSGVSKRLPSQFYQGFPRLFHDTEIRFSCL